MYIRKIVFSLCLACIVSGWASQVSAQNTVAVLGLLSQDGDDDFARTLTNELRLAAAGHWAVDARDVTTNQIQLANNCTLNIAACRSRVENELQVGSLIYGSLHRIDHGSDFDFSIEIYYAAHAQAGVSATYTGTVGSHPSSREIHSLARRIIASLAPASAAPSYDWLGWTLIGVGAAAFAGDIAVWTRLNDLNHDSAYLAYRMSFPSGSTNNVCLGASGRISDICSEGSLLEALQYVLLGAAVAAIGTGVIALILGMAGPRPPILLRPSVGPTSAKLALELAF